MNSARTAEGLWPEGKRFALTIFDDTDRGTLETLKGVYGFIRDLGIYTTKSVWPIANEGWEAIPGETCDDPWYRDWVRELQREGFEIGYHNARSHSSVRRLTERALARFRDLFGHDPYTASNHASNEEAIYWGPDRVSGVRRSLYRAAYRVRGAPAFRGHLPGDEHFWGDLCQQRIRYFRNFVFKDINTLKCCPMMPYRDPDRPYVNHWFASSDAGTLPAFLDCLTEENQDRLEEEGGACILYAHFGKGFCASDGLHPRFAALMRRLSRKQGWFVPAARLLDHLRERRGAPSIDRFTRSRLEWRWLAHRVQSVRVSAG